MSRIQTPSPGVASRIMNEECNALDTVTDTLNSTVAKLIYLISYQNSVSALILRECHF